MDGVLGIWTQGHSMVDADEMTEVLHPPYKYGILVDKKKVRPKEYKNSFNRLLKSLIWSTNRQRDQ